MSDAPASHQPELTPQQRYESALAALTAKQRRFVVEYLDTLNASEAARRAGYSEATAGQIGYQLLQKTSIVAAVSAGMDLQAMPAAEVLARLTRIARGDMGDFLRVDEEEVTLSWSLITAPITTSDDGEIEVDTGSLAVKLAPQEAVQPTDRILYTVTSRRAAARLDLLEAGRRGKLGLIKKYSLDDDGKVSIELYSSQEALALLGRAHRLFVDRAEVSGPGGEPIQVEDAREQLADRLARRLAAGDPGADPGDGRGA